MAIAPLFQRFVDDELALAPALVARVVAGTVQLLGPSKEAATSGGDRVHYADLVVALQRNAVPYEKTFVDSLRRQVAEDLDEHRGSPYSEARGANVGLELMDESRVEVDIEISRAMQLIDSTAEWELRELQTFTSTLIGQSHVSAESNPFRPLVYATALWDAACAVVDSQIQRAIVLRTSAGVAAGLLKNASAAASTRLESQGVQPGIYRTVVLPSGASFGRAVAEPPRHGALGALLASMPHTSSSGAANADAATAPTTSSDAGRAVRSDGGARRSPELEQALMRLDELLRHPPIETSRSGRASPSQRLEQHRSALLASASEPVDRQVIELVTRLFESLLADSSLPGAVSARDLAHAGRGAAPVPGRERRARLVRAPGLAPARSHRRDEPGLLAHRGSAPVRLPRLRRRRRRGDGRRVGARQRAVPARPEPDRRLPRPSSCRRSCARRRPPSTRCRSPSVARSCSST